VVSGEGHFTGRLLRGRRTRCCHRDYSDPDFARQDLSGQHHSKSAAESLDIKAKANSVDATRGLQTRLYGVELGECVFSASRHGESSVNLLRWPTTACKLIWLEPPTLR
jgi:hypothetical protein